MKQIILFAALLFTFSSCTKSSTSATENDEILRGGKWKITAYTVKFEKSPGVDSVYDIYREMDTCRFDDYVTFDSNYVGTQYSATKKCGSELDQMPFQWKLTNNQTVLVLNNAQYTIGNTNKIPVTPIGKEYVEAKIAKINKKSMTLTYQTKVEKYIPSSIDGEPGTYYSNTYYFTQTFDK